MPLTRTPDAVEHHQPRAFPIRNRPPTDLQNRQVPQGQDGQREFAAKARCARHDSAGDDEDYVLNPCCPDPQTTITKPANLTATWSSNLWTHLGHPQFVRTFPRQASQTYGKEIDRKERTTPRGRVSHAQMLGSANISGKPVCCTSSNGNLFLPIETHLFTGSPSKPLSGDRAECTRHVREIGGNK